MPVKTIQTRKFLGLNNVSDPLRLKFGWLQKADNLDITDTGALTRRQGFAKSTSALIDGAYATVDYSKLYTIGEGSLNQMNLDMTSAELRAGLQRRPVYWAEINEQVFFNNGIDSGIIERNGDVKELSWPEPDMVSLAATTGNLPAGTYQVLCTFLMADGRETGAGASAAFDLDGTQALQITGIPQQPGWRTEVYIAPTGSTVFQLAFSNCGVSATWNLSPDQLGVDLTTQFADPLPDGCSYIAVWRGQLYAAQYLPESDTSAVWISSPLGFHLFDLDSDYFQAPGRITMLAPHDDALLIGTETRIYAYDGESLKQLADYGVVPGWGAVKDDVGGQILFWSRRGLCSALPFSNLTLRQISVDCGLSAGAAIIQQNGAKKYVVALQKGGENFNQRGTK